MAIEFVDTNVFIRYFTQDDPVQSQMAFTFLQEVETGARTVTTCEGVLVEIVQVLSSKRTYNFPREDIRDGLSRIINLRGLHLPHKPLYRLALDIYASTNLDFVNALCVAHMQTDGLQTIVSFDRGLDRIQGITRAEP